MDRRSFLALAAGSVAATGVKAAPAEAPSHKAPRGVTRRPNVIVMICDDLGYGDLHCYGSQLPTPHVDQLAAEGVRLTHFNAGHPICSASRAVLMTGRYGTRMGTTGAYGPGAKSGTALDETLLPQLFHQAGYKSMAIGKWHLGSLPQYLPTSRGFDAFYGVPYSDDMKPLPLIRDTTILEEDTDRVQLTPRYTAEAVKFLESTTEPYFLYLAFSYPHHPARASERFKGKTGFGNVGDAIAEIDWSVGQIMDAVARKGETDHTLICFTSDHGPWYQGDAGRLRGRKASTFEGGFRVPFVARWPEGLPHGRVVDNWCSNLDLLPTMASICSLELPSMPLDGVDQSAVLRGEGKSPARKPVLYFAAMGNNGNDLHCIRRDGWKLRVAQNSGGEIYVNDRTTAAHASAWLPQPELYDLDRDASESYSVAAEHPEIVRELMTSLEEQMATFPPPITQAFARLRQDKASGSTPPGAAPRPVNRDQPDWDYEAPPAPAPKG
jgi:arylsulfatase A